MLSTMFSVFFPAVVSNYTYFSGVCSLFLVLSSSFSGVFYALLALEWF